jgi:formylglycine-generating enzyme required for sulfatase activity
LPAIRVSWDEATEFCRWLSKKTGKNVTLPTEAQWEWAARAGSNSPLWYGDLNTDFSKYANLGDVSLKKLAVSGVDPQPIPNPGKDVDFVPKEERFNDGVLHLAPCGQYEANPWGLKDMAGNVAEWTRSTYLPYPAKTSAGSNKTKAPAKMAVRGGSWYDRPRNARSGFRQSYPPWQKVSNVGLRIIVED